MMPTLTLTDDQVIELAKQLSPGGKQTLLMMLAADQENWLEEMERLGEEQMRQLCAQCGLEWDAMSKDERAAFADDLARQINQTQGEILRQFPPTK
jgi:hypothetical protein